MGSKPDGSSSVIADSVRGVSAWIKMLRPFHWVKNLLVLFPVFFAQAITDTTLVSYALVGFLCFCLLSSAVYVLNDLSDIEKDRAHPTKRFRPLASGAVSQSAGVACLTILLVLSIALAFLAALISGNRASLLLPAAYFATNVAYSNGLKNVPVLDVVLVALGFVLRLFYGGAITGIEISEWLFLTVSTAALFLGFGKRRNELRGSGSLTRGVLDSYSIAFLTPILYVFMTLTIAFYALWALGLSNGTQLVTYSIVLVMIIFTEYARIIESDSDGDPAEVLKSSKQLAILALLFSVTLFFALY